MCHTYGEGLSFYYITKEEMDKLLDRLKIISEPEYQREAKDGFQSLYQYWNARGREALMYKIEQLDTQIDILK